MKSICKFVLFCIIITITTPIYGQLYKGRVVNSEKHPIEHVRVRIVSDKTIRNETITDLYGLFSINNDSTSDFLLEFYFTGYKIKQINIKSKKDTEYVDLDDITLMEEIIELDGVTVSGNSIINKGNLMIVFPEKKIIDASSTTLDLFQKMYVPGLYIDPISQTIKIDNSSNITYKINNINSSIQEVISLNPKTISRIEYQRSPDTRNIDSDAVINILLKKETGTMLSGNVLGAFTTGFINENLTVSTGYTNSNLNISYNFSWRDYKKRFANEYEVFNRDDEIITLNKKGENAPFGYLQQNINIGYNYTKGRNIFNIKLLNNIYSSHDKNRTNTYANNLNAINSIRNINSNNKYYFPYLDAYYILNISKNKSIDMNLVGSIGNSKYARDYREIFINEDIENESKTNITGKNKSIIYEFLFSEKSIEKLNYQLGMKTTYSYNENKSEYGILQKEYNKRLDLYPYLSLNGKIGSISYMIGTGIKFLNNESRELNKNYTRNISNLSLFYKSNEIINFQYIFTYTPYYPLLYSLSDIEQTVDNNIKIKGNPSLKPYTSIKNTLNISFRQKKYISSTLSLYHSNFYKPIREVINYNQEFFLIQPQNINKEYSLGAKLETSFNSIFNHLDLRIGLGWNSYNSIVKDVKHNLDNFYWSFMINYYYKDFSASFSWKKPEKILTGEQTYESENNSFINAMYKYKVFGFAVGLYFPFTKGAKYASSRVSDIAPMDRHVYIKDNSYMFFIGVSYYVNWGKSLFNIKRNRNNSVIDNSILKVNDN